MLIESVKTFDFFKNNYLEIKCRTMTARTNSRTLKIRCLL